MHSYIWIAIAISRLRQHSSAGLSLQQCPERVRCELEYASEQPIVSG